MGTYRTQRTVQWTTAQAYELVADVEQYPDFLPGWHRVTILRSDKNQAEVEVYISASFQLKTAEGERWHRMTDYNKLVLVKDKDRWLFIRGM